MSHPLMITVAEALRGLTRRQKSHQIELWDPEAERWTLVVSCYTLSAATRIEAKLVTKRPDREWRLMSRL